MSRPPSPRRRLLEWLAERRPELVTLLLLALVGTAAWAFLVIAAQVKSGDSSALDRALLLALRHPDDLAVPIGPPWCAEMVRDYSALGSVGVLALFTAAAAGFLWIDGKPRAAALLVLAITAGLALSTLLKLAFERPRPQVVPHLVTVHDPSFPSGHSLLSAVTYLTLGALLARLQPRRRVKIYVMAVAVVLTLLVGTSRVYLGVHWPTDVLAGWAAGAGWAVLCWLAALRLQQRGQVEEAAEDEGSPAS